MKKLPPAVLFAATLALIAIVTLFGPPEKTLGVNVRIVYLHGAWVWAALAGLAAAGAAGLVGLVTGRSDFHDWSKALGRTGLFFWITYLPISLWAMQTNWNGLFLAEPRWRVALIFGSGGLVIQVALAFMREPALTSFANLAFIAGLGYVLAGTEQVMHPPSPIFDSNAAAIQGFFVLLTALVMLAAWQMAQMWRRYGSG